MESSDVIKPFRWDLARREQLGALVESAPAATPTWFDDELLRCCARVVAFAGDSDLAFVGRSPEPLFDLLSGILLETSWADRLSILNLSLRYASTPGAEEAATIEPYLRSLGLSPGALAARQRAVAFVDVVASGWTFDRFVELLQLLSRREGVEWKTFARKLRFVGLTSREKTSPNTWRWQQHAEWVGPLVPATAIKNVSIPLDFFRELAASEKATHSFPPWRWADAEVRRPLHDEDARAALALALQLFELGRRRETRLQFVRLAAREPAMREPWLRGLLGELKR